jgi:hypothetical protein
MGWKEDQRDNPKLLENRIPSLWRLRKILYLLMLLLLATILWLVFRIVRLND